MPLPNGVDPQGNIHPVCPSAGWLGNRGELHDAPGQLVRPWKLKAWVTCRLQYKGWNRKPLMQPGRYTELFFLDEATALAAGHRPCGMCRREQYVLFRTLWLRANQMPEAWRIDDIDRMLHVERTNRSSEPAWQRPLSTLPRGVIVLLRQSPHLWDGEQLRPWTPNGYGRAERADPQTLVELCTPPSVVNAIEAGYPVQLHASADDPAGAV